MKVDNINRVCTCEEGCFYEDYPDYSCDDCPYYQPTHIGEGEC